MRLSDLENSQAVEVAKHQKEQCIHIKSFCSDGAIYLI